jgi:iron-sulfur cluster insertion protein
VTLMHDFNITSAAAARIKQLRLSENQEDLKLRIAVDGGGCSGFRYQYLLESEIASDDLVFQHDGVEVIIDDCSIEHLKGSTLDFAEDLGSAEFVINNPQATAKCGCGHSFAI